MNSRCRLRSGFRLCFAGVLALALFTTACSGGTDVTAEVDAAVAATVEAVRSTDEAVAATVEPNQSSQPATIPPAPEGETRFVWDVISVFDDIVESAIQANPDLASLSTLLIVTAAYTLCELAVLYPTFDELAPDLLRRVSGEMTYERLALIAGNVSIELCSDDIVKHFDVEVKQGNQSVWPTAPEIAEIVEGETFVPSAQFFSYLDGIVEFAIQAKPDLASDPKATIFAMAYLVCEFHAVTTTFEEMQWGISQIVDSTTWTAEQIGSVVGYVSIDLCPSDIEKYADLD